MTTFFEEFCSRLNIDWSDIGDNDLYSETELTRWLTLSKDEAVARYPWPFTEGKRDLTSVGGQEQYNYPTDMKSDSIRYLTVNSMRYTKLLFEDYLKYKEDYSSNNDKYFSDRSRTIYINVLASDFANTICVYGQVEVSGTVSSSATSTIFTEAEPEGDEAIVKLAYSKALASEKMKDLAKARIERQEAFEILDGIWKRIAAKQHTYQTKDSPMFKRLDVLEGGYDGDNPLQF